MGFLLVGNVMQTVPYINWRLTLYVLATDS